MADFFQRAPPFLIQLQNILRKYPDGGQILKELIQNADDAKASEVIFVYDEREYGTDVLYAKEQHVIQGPSLLAYNNEIFSDRDWHGIQRPGDSIKRKDPNTVGRFGLGFNSVYHMTDYPAIFSGKNIGILDPQENIFHRGGRLWNIEKKDTFSEDLKDQFEPFKSVLEPLGLGSWKEILDAGYFKGTLFCFPLRLCPSEISDNLYSAERVEELFASFMKDSSIALLFLRHVTSITLKKIEKDGIVKTLLTVNLSSKTLLCSEHASFAIQTLSKIISLKYLDNEEEESEWLVTTSKDLGNLFPELSELSIKLCNKPVLDLAYPLSRENMDLFGGRLNCILPLPDKEENQTGLPCLINGCFDLTDDRRSLKWPETDQQHDEGAQWNQILVNKVLPIIYTQAVVNGVMLVKKSKLTVDMAYGIWPDPEKNTHKSRWHNIVRKISLCLQKEQVLQTADTCQWITAQEAVFMMVQNVEIRTCLEELLLLLKVPLVKVPGHVFKILCMAQKNISDLNIVSPGFVRNLLRKDNWLNFPAEKKLLLLKYIIEDGQTSELLNLKLLPLSDGSFTSFQNKESNGMVYIDSEEFPRTLLPGLAHRFIPEDLPDDLHLFFLVIGKSKTFKNLVCLSVEVICKTLHLSLPQKWNGSDKVHWHPGDPDNPPVEWIETMWTFLQKYNNILDDFENQPIVPLSVVQSNSKSILMARLQKKKILFQNSDGHNIVNDITVILERVGCTIIRNKNAWMWHKNLHLFILTPTPNNVLQTLSNLNLNQILEVFKSVSKKHGKMFCDLFSQAYQFTSSELNILYKLTIFSSVKTTAPSQSKTVAASCLTALDCNTVPAIPDTLAFPYVVIKCRDESDKRLLQLMKIQLLNAVDVALNLVVAIQNGSYTNHQSEAQNVMFWILQNGYVLFTQSDKLKSMCQNLSFIPCNGHLRSPSVLYDPEVNTLRVLFEEDKFPPVKYHEDLILKSLRMLGLLDSIDKITAEDVLKIAQQLSQSKQTTSLLKKADTLIEVCNSTTVLTKFSLQNLQGLRSLSWVPASSKGLRKELEKPINMRSMKYFNIVEFSMPLTNCFTEKANNLLGLNDLPPPKKVVKNLTELSLKYKSKDQYSFYPKLHEIYKYIQDHITQFQKDLLKLVVIWNGNGFSLPHKTVLCYPEGLDLSSYVNKVSSDFLTYKSLFTRCGVKSSLPNDEVIHILNTLKDQIDKECPDSGSLKDLKLVIAILDWMKVNSVCGTDDLPIPVQSNKRCFSLKPLSKALYCDMEKQHLASVAMDYDIVHEEISMATARYFNIQLLSTKVLKPEFFDLWGPSEPVTLRIKNILREYSEQVEIFKEMIQNADDADAMNCHFLVDMRQNSEIRKKLIDSGMARCHGPALWSYNNSKFTESDFINIIRIGAATKEYQVQKIGKFGLGFNTVYHITDVPSIMSGSKLLLFDPNANHLQKHISKLNPGMKLDLQKNSQLLHIFSDQFQPFSDVFECNLAQPFYFDGTLIRLPFRTEEESRESEICRQAFSEEQIHAFMTDFENSSETLLIFLKNVKEVSLSHLSNGECPGFQTTKVNLQKETVQKLHISQEVPLQQEQLSVSRQLCKHMDSLDIDCTKIVKISVQKTSTTDRKFYIIQSGIGVKNFVQNENQSCLPVAGVALPLKKNPSTGKWTSNLEGFQGMVFCFLPLPVSTGLPFHINGTFSVMSNRKSLWETTAKGNWNKHLLCDPVLVAVITALLQLQAMNKNGELEDYHYHTFWPDITKVNTQFMEMVKSFYHAVALGIKSSLPPLFSNGQECCTRSHACFLDLEMFEDETIQELAKKVFSKYLKKPYLAIDLPDWVKYSFIVSNNYDQLQKNLYSCERFYKEIVFENLDRLEMEDRNALIIYAIDLKNKELNGLLISKPCIPSSLHGNLQFIRNLVHPKGKVSPLYDPEEGCFPEGEEFLKRMESLHALGLLKDKLPLKELKEKACKIKNIWTYDRKKALKQIVCILDLLHDLLKEHGSIEDQSFRDIIFLPAVPPQSNATKLNDLTLMKATDLYHYKHKALVSMIYPILGLTQPDDIIAFLGIDRQLSSQIVISQLQKASEGVNLLSDDESLSIAKGCYNYLNDFLEEEQNNADLIKEQASAFPFVYIDGEFVPVNMVAHKISFDASPYLYKLPKLYEKFENLWDSVEICKEFTFLHYFSVLEKMAIEHKQNPLSARELSMAMDLINHSLEKIPDSIASNSLDISKIFVPDMKCILRHVDKIFYNDTPWLPYDKHLNYCNELIPRAVVSKLGVKTRKHHTLQKLKISSLSNWGSEFGSKEKLTTRIKNILKEYSSKKDIVKELLQNADDAEASEIHFVLDNRLHKTKRVFGQEWCPLQGPALCVYNNKKFNDTDIEGIQQLGIGGKGENFEKTGKFGLGFNSVYHITDCPSFVTADTMMGVFDPNLMFLDVSNDASPGGKFNVTNVFKETFQDVYDTFLPSLFNLQEGTIFRLPLRMADTVAKSQISNHTVSLEDIRNMCEELNKDEDMILFLNHIRKITFSEILRTGDVKEKFSVETKIDEANTMVRSSFQQKLCNYVKNEDFQSESSPFRILSTIEVKHSNSSTTTHWLIVRQLGIEQTNGSDTLEEMSNNLHKILIPHGSIAACLYKKVKGRAFCTLPLPVETGLPVHINANFIVDSARRNISKEDGDSPKTAWNMLLLSNLIAPLYCYLLERLCDKFKTKLHFQNFDSCKLHLDRFLEFFPISTDNVTPEWKTVVTQVYLSISEHKLEIIPVYKTCKAEKKFEKGGVAVEWSNIGKTSISEEPFFVTPKKTSIEPVLHSINMQLAYGDVLYKAFNAAGVNVLKLSPETLCRFLKETPLLLNGHSLPSPVSRSKFRNEENCNSLLGYCLKDHVKKKVDLQGIPLLVTVDGLLHYCDREKPKFPPTHSALFPSADGEFLKFWNYSALETDGFVRHLDIKSSVTLVKNQLGPMYEISSKTNAPYLQLSQDMVVWLKGLWSFFTSEIERQKAGEQEKQFKEILALFNHWAIVPVNGKMSTSQKIDKYILPLADLKNICLPCSGDITQCLLKLGFPELVLSVFYDSSVYNKTIIPYLQPYMLNTENLELVLEQLCSIDDLKSKLKGEELDNLLYLILKKLQSEQNKDFLFQKLKSLPLFQTIEDQRLSIDMCKNIYLLDTTFDLKPFRLFDLYPKTIYLKKNLHNEMANTFMKIPLIKDLEFLTGQLLSDLALFNEEQLLHILHMVLALPYDSYRNKENQILASLKPARLIKDKCGELQRASYFYDNKINLFSVLELQDQFIPHGFWKKFERNEYAIRKLLINLGMKNSLSESDFIKFATEVEKNAKGNNFFELLHAKAEALYNYLLSMDLEKMSNTFAPEVQNIAFVIPMRVDKKLKALHPPFTEKVATVALQGSLLYRNSYDSLVWTSLPLLTNYTQGKTMEILCEKFGVLKEPPNKKIIDNIKNLCKVSCGSIDLQKARSEVLQQIYEFMQRKGDDLDVTTLKDVQFILVNDEKDIAFPKQVVFSLHEEMHFCPYLYKVPPMLACYSKLFQKVGVEAEPSVVHFADVLSTIHSETLDKTSLHPNLKRTILEATKQFFNLVEHKKDTEKLNSLHLLAHDDKLYESSSLVLNNCRSVHAVSKKLRCLFKFVCMNTLFGTYQQENLIKLLPKKIRPQMLSDITQESLTFDEENLCSYGDQCTLKVRFEKVFFSKIFKEGLVCLLQHQTKGKMSKEEAMEKWNLVFGMLEIICCSNLQTVLVHDDKALDGTQCSKIVFATKNQDSGCTIYFKHSDSMEFRKIIHIVQVLSKEINNLMQNVLTLESLLVVTQMLSCDDPSKITEVLKENDLWNDISEQNTLFTPNPGEKIPIEWIDCLDMSITNTFRIGDYVGYLIPSEEETYLYAVIEKILDKKILGSCEIDMFLINIGQNKIEVSVLDLYQFKRSESQSMKSLVLLENPPPVNGTQSCRPEASIVDLKKEIDLELNKIWGFPKDERKTAIRRLYLKYHPDKNINSEQVFTEACKYLQQRIKEKESGKTMNNHTSSSSSNCYRNTGGFSNFWEKWDKQAHNHRNHREHFSRKTRCDYDFWGYHSAPTRPKPQEADRWLRQAICDLKAAEHDVGYGHTEWVFYKVHQAVEKACFAAQYLKVGEIEKNETIVSLAQTVSSYSSKLQSIYAKVVKMKACGVDKQRTQYPSYYAPPGIPNNRLDPDHEEKVIALAKSVVKEIESYING